MDLRIYREKILLVLHIRSMDSNSFANLIYEEQKNIQWPGLAKEASVICQSLNIEDCNQTSLDKQSSMKLVKAAINLENERRLRLLAHGKCQQIVGEDYGKKEYIANKNIFRVWQQYRARLGLEKFAGNYSSLSD